MMLRKLNSSIVEAPDPSAEQRSGFHLTRVDAPCRSRKRFNPEPSRPFARCVCVEFRKQIEPDSTGLIRAAVTRRGQIAWLRMRQVQASTTRDQELAADRSHRIKDSNRGTARHNLCRAQTCRPTADYGDMHGIVDVGCLPADIESVETWEG
jgi:hypothetical protein